MVGSFKEIEGPTLMLKKCLEIAAANARDVLGPILQLRLGGEGRVRWETLKDVWCGMGLKHISDHLGYGVKTGLPYVWRDERGDAVESLRKKWEGVDLMEKSVPCFESLKLPETALKVEDCVVNWIQLWTSVNSSILKPNQ
ncbi:hypothetical protein HA466_0042470 [Hirschfeldia incana]|nr:hypothetical protein HA466_0042470 [Hirschfeldia incana]